MATDDDCGLNASINYSLEGDGIDQFEIDKSTGIITTHNNT